MREQRERSEVLDAFGRASSSKQTLLISLPARFTGLLEIATVLLFIVCTTHCDTSINDLTYVLY